jgi:DNA sulfur modification protein DndD
MLIKRIKARNYKTYLDLDLDLTVDKERPIILIGGINGGGKTTFFEAIYGALYGLEIKDARHFHELLNVGAMGTEEPKILLELQFSGLVLNHDQQYILTRTYILNASGIPVESVKLNLDGDIFQYGTATPASQRATQKEQVDKILKANLPQELSKYFLFDAMMSGHLLEKDQLSRVIRENIENVMGFSKYISLANISESIFQNMTAQRIQRDEEKKEYVELTKQKKQLTSELKTKETSLQDALDYSVKNRELYESIKKGIDEEKTIKSKIDSLQKQVEVIYSKEKMFLDEAEKFTKNFENHISLPKVAESLRSKITLILREVNEKKINSEGNLSFPQIEKITAVVIRFLKENGIDFSGLSDENVINFAVKELLNTDKEYKYDYLEHSEIKAFENLINENYVNPFPDINTKKADLDISIDQIPKLNGHIEELKAQITGKDYTLLQSYEANEEKIKNIQAEIKTHYSEIQKLEEKIQRFDIQTSEEPDPKYEMVKKLKPFFEEVANKLLQTKKQQIEIEMKEDLNTNLSAYKDVIDRVELSDNLNDLTFKLFHVSGNEISLNQLNTASKQIVVQVLLKSLREFGDYDPPVMIDTVMGVLDAETRDTIIENYFPALSHQTILLSSDTEIRDNQDFEKIESFVSKAFTLNRDKKRQNTTVVDGYFNRKLSI